MLVAVQPAAIIPRVSHQPDSSKSDPACPWAVSLLEGLHDTRKRSIIEWTGIKYQDRACRHVVGQAIDHNVHATAHAIRSGIGPEIFPDHSPLRECIPHLPFENGIQRSNKDRAGRVVRARFDLGVGLQWMQVTKERPKQIPSCARFLPEFFQKDRV